MILTCFIEEFEENGHRVCLLKEKKGELFFLFREVKPVLPPIFDDEIILFFERTHSQKFGHCWCLTEMQTSDGHELAHMGNEEVPLSSRRILIHAGNVAEDSAGCFLPGLSARWETKLRINSSKLAMAKLEEKVGKKSFAIRVIGSFKSN